MYQVYFLEEGQVKLNPPCQEIVHIWLYLFFVQVVQERDVVLGWLRVGLDWSGVVLQDDLGENQCEQLPL